MDNLPVPFGCEISSKLPKASDLPRLLSICFGIHQEAHHAFSVGCVFNVSVLGKHPTR